MFVDIAMLVESQVRLFTSVHPSCHPSIKQLIKPLSLAIFSIFLFICHFFPMCLCIILTLFCSYRLFISPACLCCCLIVHLHLSVSSFPAPCLFMSAFPLLFHLHLITHHSWINMNAFSEMYE